MAAADPEIKNKKGPGGLTVYLKTEFTGFAFLYFIACI